MGKTQYYTATSIDGFIADENNSLDWLFEVGSGQDTGGRYTEFFRDVKPSPRSVRTVRGLSCFPPIRKVASRRRDAGLRWR